MLFSGALAACGGGSASTTTTTGSGPLTSAVQDLAPKVTWQLDPAGDQRRYRALLQAVAALPGGAGVQPVFNGTDDIQTFVCTPAGQACKQAVTSGRSLAAPGAYHEVDTYTDNGTAGPTFGEGFTATTVPGASGQLALDFSYGESDGKLTGGGFSMTFVWLTPALLAQIRATAPVDYFDLSSLAPDLRAQEVTITAAPTYDFAQPGRASPGNVNATLGIGPDAPTVLGALQPYLVSASSFESHERNRLAALLTSVAAQVHSGVVKQATDCHRHGDGAPLCHLSPLSASLPAALVKQATSDIDTQESFVSAHGPAMYEALASATLLPSCPTCWS